MFRHNSTLLGKWTLAGAAAILLVGAALLQAAPQFTLELASTPETSTENTGVSAAIGFDIFNTSKGFVVELTFMNTTSPSLGSKLTAIGLEWPDFMATLPTFAKNGTSSYFDRLDYNYSVNPGWLNAPGGYDVMITSDGSFEGGSPKGAPQAGQSQTVRLSLGPTSLTLPQVQDDFAAFYAGGGKEPLAIARFQSVGPCGSGSDKVITPEPATIGLLAIGLVAFVRRKG